MLLINVGRTALANVRALFTGRRGVQYTRQRCKAVTGERLPSGEYRQCLRAALPRQVYCWQHSPGPVKVGTLILPAIGVIVGIIGALPAFEQYGPQIGAAVAQLFAEAPAPPPKPDVIPKEGVWLQASDMHEARYDHGLVLLPNGRVLVATGRNVWEEDVRLKSSELYDSTTNTWASSGDINTPRIWFDNLVALSDGKVLLAAGASIKERDQFALAELYDPSTGTWTNTGSLNTARSQPTLTLLDDGRVLAAGGGNGLPDANRFLASTEIYDPKTGNWSLTGSLHTARESHQAVRLHDGRVFVGGGERSWKAFTDTSEIYDPASGSWILAGTRPVAWGYASMTVLVNGKVLVAGGVSGLESWNQGDLTYYDNADLYDPETGRWSTTGPMNVARSSHTATLLNDGRVLVVGGENNTGTLSSSEIYDPNTGTWELVAQLKTDRATHRAVLLPDGTVLVVGGTQGDPTTSALKSAEIYVLPVP